MNAYQIIGVVIAGVLAAAGIGAGAQALAARRDRRRFPPPGELVDVGGHRLHLTVSGEPTAAPTVVLEAGMASMSSNWGWVRAALAQDGRVVAYDRAGLGWSDDGTPARDAATSAGELHTALGAAGVGPPYVLAGHSYGGLVSRMFADRYPGEVAGMVLVDASHPDQWAHIPASRDGRTVALGNRVTAALAGLGLLRLFRAERSFIDGLPAREYAEMRAYLAGPRGLAGRRRRAARVGPAVARPGRCGPRAGRPAAGGAQRDRTGPVRRRAHRAPGRAGLVVHQQPARHRRRRDALHARVAAGTRRRGVRRDPRGRGGGPVRRRGPGLHRRNGDQIVMATLPRTLPSSMWRMASGARSSGYVRSTLGVTLPATMSPASSSM